MLFYGINPVMEALRSGRLPERIWLEQRKRSEGAERIRRLARRHGVPTETVANVGNLCKAREHQGVCAEIAETAVVRPFERDVAPDRYVMLDGVQDPHNFGASLRVCEVFGVRRVIFQKGNSSGLTPAAIKASAGAVFHLDVRECRLNSATRKLKAAGVHILALDAGGETGLYTVSVPAIFCLVVGSESRGVRFAVKRQADARLTIPMRGRINSLNLSCALSVALAELVRHAPADN